MTPPKSIPDSLKEKFETLAKENMGGQPYVAWHLGMSACIEFAERVYELTLAHLVERIGEFEKPIFDRILEFGVNGGLMWPPGSPKTKISYGSENLLSESAFNEWYERVSTAYEAKLALQDEIIEDLVPLLESIRSDMCWLLDRDQLPMMIADHHTSVTQTLTRVTVKLEALRGKK